MIVNLQNDVGPAANQPADAVGREARGHPRGPGPQAGIRKIETAVSAGPTCEARRRVVTLAATGIARLVQIDSAVMRDPAVARAKLDGVDRDVMVERER